MVEDGFRFKCVDPKWIISKNNKFLILKECALKAQNLSTEEQELHPGEAHEPSLLNNFIFRN